MAWHLHPLHSPSESPIVLPREGTVTVGRRPGNNILCKDAAVSGNHCILHCRGGNLLEPPEVEDCSTNGSYISQDKITKGQRRCLAVGDVLSLTKPPDEAGEASVRVQFRLEYAENAADNVPSTCDIPLTAPEPKLASGGVESCFAQDLLVQEQQSKAKITAQLLQSQGKLEEERQAAEAASRELEKVRKQVAEERARRHEAEESRDRLSAEAEALRVEHRQLKELNGSHEELRQRHEVVQAELQTRQQKCGQLEASQDQLRKDLEKAVESHQKASQQHAEVQTRARQAQERSDRLQQQYEEAKREADWVQEQSGRLENELTSERKAREELEEQVSKIKDQVSKAEAAERTAREALDAATAKRAELECQASSAHSDLEGAKASARQAQQRLTASKQLVERLQEAGRCLSTELKRRAEVWANALAEGNFDGLDDALASGGPTFAQVTCQVDSQPAKSSQEGRRHVEDAASKVNESSPVPATHAHGDAPAPATEATSPEGKAQAPALLCPAASTSVLAAPEIDMAQKHSPQKPVEEVAIDIDEEDDLLAAVSRGTVEGATTTGAKPLALGASATTMPGCSTAWSLEVLDAVSGGDVLPPAKKARLNGD